MLAGRFVRGRSIGRGSVGTYSSVGAGWSVECWQAGRQVKGGSGLLVCRTCFQSMFMKRSKVLTVGGLNETQNNARHPFGSFQPSRVPKSLMPVRKQRALC